MGRTHGLQAAGDLVAGVLDRAAVEVGAGARGGRGGVGHLVGAGRREPHPAPRDAERRGGDLEHLGVQTLPHLGAAVVDQHRAVLVDVHQGTRLVERGEVERDAELHRRDGQPALAVRMGGVVRRDLGLPAYEVAGRGHLLPGGDHPLGVADGLAVRRGLALGVEVAAAQLLGRETEQRRAAADDVLDDEHPLRAAEAAEGRLRGLVGPRDPPVHAHVWEPVGVVDVAQGAGEHRLGEVEAPAAVRGEGCLQRGEPALVVEPGPPGGVEAVPLAGHRDVLLAAEPQPHGSARERGAQGGHRGEAVRLHLLAAEPAAHPQALHGDPVARYAEHVGGDLLGLGGVLGAGLHEHLAVLVDARQAALGLQVEVLLARRARARPRRRAGPRRSRCPRRRAPAPAGRPGSSAARSPRAASALPAAARSRPRPRRPRGGRPRGSRRGTQHTACPWYITSSGNSGSSCLTPESLRPGTSALVSTRTTPGTARAGRVSSRVIRACACGAWTGWACSTPLWRNTRSSV